MTKQRENKKSIEEIRKEMWKKRKPVQLREYFSTGSLVFDHLLNGGLRTGDGVLLLGKPQAGKTTFIFMMVASLIQKGKRVLYINTEGKSDYNYLKRAIGIDESIDPNSEEFLNIIETFDQHEQEETYELVMKYLTNKMVDVVFIDSVSAFSPSDYAYTAENPAFAKTTLLNNKVIPRIANICQANNILVVYTAQYRANLDNPYEQNIQGGTYVMKHGVPVILELKSVTSDIKGNVSPEIKKAERYAYISEIKVVKGQAGLVENKTASTLVILPNMTPFYDTASEILDVGGLIGLFEDKDGNPIDHRQRGATVKIHHYNGVALGNRNDAIEYLKKDSKLREELYEVVRQYIIRGNSITVTGVPKSFDEIDNNSEFDDDVL